MQVLYELSTKLFSSSFAGFAHNKVPMEVGRLGGLRGMGVGKIESLSYMVHCIVLLFIQYSAYVIVVVVIVIDD